MFLSRVAVRSQARSSARTNAVQPCRRASSVTTTGSKAVLPSHPEHLAKLQKALDSGDAKAVVEVANALNKLSSSLSQDQKAALAAETSSVLKEVAQENGNAAAALKEVTLPHEQLLAALPEWHNTRGYEINTVQELEQHWQKWLKSHKLDGEAALQKMFAEGGADLKKTETALFEFLGGLSTVRSKEQAVEYFKKHLPDMLDKPYILGQPNPMYQGAPVSPSPQDHAIRAKLANAQAHSRDVEPWYDFVADYLDYLVDDGSVNPAVLKRMYEVDLALAVGSGESMDRLVKVFEAAFQKASARFQNPAKSAEVFGEFKQRVAEVFSGRATPASFRMTSLNDDKVQERYEDLIKNHPTFKNLDWETKLQIARSYDLSLGYQTLEWTWPSPPPAHTWVELPVYKPVDDHGHHGHGHGHGGQGGHH